MTKEFTEWVSSLGGESNIDESTITSLFTKSYESKPALSIPIEIVELSNVPQELHMTTNIYQPTNQFMANIPSNEETRPPWVSNFFLNTINHPFCKPFWFHRCCKE